MNASATHNVALTPRPARSRRWPLMIVGLLLAHVIGMVTAVVIATTDKSFVVLPNYYQRALQWDQHKAATLATEKLGWQRSISIDAGSGRGRTVTLRLLDADQKPVDGLVAQITAAPERKPDHVQTLQMKSIGDGRYVAPLVAEFGGVWNFDIDAVRGDQHYVATALPWIE